MKKRMRLVLSDDDDSYVFGVDEDSENDVGADSEESEDDDEWEYVSEYALEFAWLYPVEYAMQLSMK